MGLASKAIAAAVCLGVAWLLVDGYGDARYDAGWQAATIEQRKAADIKKQEAEAEKAESARRLTALQSELDGTMERLNRLKIEKLHSDETYAKFRAMRVHPVTRCRIWGLCDTAPAGRGDLRAAGSQPRPAP